MAARDCHEMMRLGYGKVSKHNYCHKIGRTLGHMFFSPDFAEDQLQVLPWRVDDEDRGALGV